MNRVDSQAMPAPPSLMKSLKAGFDVISNHILLIFFPVVLDLLLWLGPHFSLRQLVLAMSAQFEEAADMTEMALPAQDIWMLVAERFNLLSALRTFPIGVTSLMVSRSPVEVPGGQPLVWEVTSFGAVFAIWVLLTLAGLALGALYFTSTSQAAVWGSVNWLETFKRWPRVSLQSIGLALVWLMVLLTITIPFMCVMPFLALAGSAALPVSLFVYSLLLAWVIFPLMFSPHGIFAYGLGIWASVRRGIVLVRNTLPLTAFFLLIALMVSEGLNMIWNVPPESSWMMVVGIAGHAFITTGLLAASFVYYRDADLWVQNQQQAVKA